MNTNSMSGHTAFALVLNGSILDVTMASDQREAALRMWTSAELPEGYSVQPLAAQTEQKPVAWIRMRFITDRDGRPIGTDDPEVVVQADMPDWDGGWGPLFAGAGA
jgi:hypothetical protein